MTNIRHSFNTAGICFWESARIQRDSLADFNCLTKCRNVAYFNSSSGTFLLYEAEKTLKLAEYFRKYNLK